MAELASKIEYIRSSNRVTVRELAKLTGLSTKTIWRFEKGKSISLRNVFKILRVFDCYLSIMEKPTELDNYNNFDSSKVKSWEHQY